jgi:thiamine-monophosphate kinase
MAWLKSDAVVEGVHFETDAPAARIGHKALARVLSDFAAMGAEPQHVLVNLVAPPSTPVRRRAGVCGLNRLARRWGVAVVGGETVSGPALELHVFGSAGCRAGVPCCASGARANDVVFVTGALGGSILGHHLRVCPRACVRGSGCGPGAGSPP